MGAEFSAGPLPRELKDFRKYDANQVEVSRLSALLAGWPHDCC